MDEVCDHKNEIIQGQQRGNIVRILRRTHPNIKAYIHLVWTKNSILIEVDLENEERSRDRRTFRGYLQLLQGTKKEPGIGILNDSPRIALLVANWDSRTIHETLHRICLNPKQTGEWRSDE